MAEPLVSIVTPSFNHGRFIRSTIESVLAQDYPNLEYIVMDGGSADETAAVVKDYASRLRFISEPDRGQSHAINKGFRMARGSILFWLNSDDLILPGAVRHAVDALQENPQAGAVYGEGYLIDEQGKIKRRFPCTEPFNLWKLVYLSDYILQQTAYFRRSAIDAAGDLREDLHFAMDWDLLIRIGKKYPLQYIPDYMGCLREHAAAKSSSGGMARAREIARLLREHTGMNYPPGAIVYGLETCATMAAGWPAPLNALLTRASGYVIGRTILRAQRWYGDGWVGHRFRYLLPPGAPRVLVMEGWIPPWRGRKQELTLIAQERPVARREFFGGDFRWRVPLPGAALPLDLEIHASRSFVPLFTASGLDRRRLSYILRAIGVEHRRRATQAAAVGTASTAR